MSGEVIIGSGIDIIEISRIKKAVDRWGDEFLSHIFNPEEIAYSSRQKNPYQHYAVRFAAKEAVFKAVGDLKLSWKDVTITHDSDGKPVCVHRSPGFSKKILISLSHCKEYAVASAIVTS